MDDDGSDVPMRTPAGTFTAVSVGEYNACAMRADGKAVCWGEWDEYARPAPRMAFTAPEWVRRLTIPLRWGATPLFARITGYDVDLVTAFDEDGNATAWDSLRVATTERRATYRGKPGQEHCWRARAHDADGLVSPWAYQCTKLPDDDAVFSRSDGWSTVRGSGYYLGRASLATRRGASLSLSVATGGLGIMVTTCPSCGAIKVYVDGESDGTIVSLRSNKTANREVVAWSDNGEEGFFGQDDESRSTITIKVVSAGRRVIIDGIVLDRCPGCS